jgi:hypothetical protein
VTYRSSFERWDELSWVRAKPRRSSPFARELLYFSPDQCPVLGHPEVARAPVGEEILIHALYLYLEFTVRLETGPVNEICAALRSPAFLSWLPPRMKEDALRIYADEAGHAEMTGALLSAVRAETSVEPVPHKPWFLRELARLRGDRRPMVKLFFVIVSETLITGTLTELPRDQRVQRAVREVVSDHAADEARHHAFFRQLFDLLWPRLPAAERHEISLLLPEIVLAFLTPDVPAWTAVLGRYPKYFPEPGRIAAETAARFTGHSTGARTARATLGMLRQAGVLDPPDVALAFGRAGLLEEPCAS